MGISGVLVVLMLSCLVGIAMSGTPTVSDEVSLNVGHGDSLTFQCSGITNSILLLSANYVQPEATPAPKRKAKGSSATDVVQPVAWCPQSSAIVTVGPACDAKTKCTVKAQDPAREPGCSKRPLRIRYKCVATGANARRP